MDPMALFSDFLSKTEVVILLDCCYSGSAIRGSNNSDRIVEVISAVGSTQKALGNLPSNDQRVSAITFTARLTTEIAFQHKGGANSICFAEIIQTLMEKASRFRRPQCKLMVGAQAIRIPLKAAALPPLGHSSRRPPTISSDSLSSGQAIAPVPTDQVHKELRVVVQVHINNERQEAGVQSVLDWFEDREQAFLIELIGVFETNPSLILFTVPRSIWAQLEASQEPSFILVGEVWGRGLYDRYGPPFPRSGGDLLDPCQGNYPARGKVSS